MAAVQVDERLEEGGEGAVVQNVGEGDRGRERGSGGRWHG